MATASNARAQRSHAGVDPVSGCEELLLSIEHLSSVTADVRKLKRYWKRKTIQSLLTSAATDGLTALPPVSLGLLGRRIRRGGLLAAIPNLGRSISFKEVWIELNIRGCGRAGRKVCGKFRRHIFRGAGKLDIVNSVQHGHFFARVLGALRHLLQSRHGIRVIQLLQRSQGCLAHFRFWI